MCWGWIDGSNRRPASGQPPSSIFNEFTEGVCVCVSVCGCVNAVWALSTVRVCQWVAWRQNLVFSNFLSSSSRNQIENSPEVTVGGKCKFGKKNIWIEWKTDASGRGGCCFRRLNRSCRFSLWTPPPPSRNAYIIQLWMSIGCHMDKVIKHLIWFILNWKWGQLLKRNGQF